MKYQVCRDLTPIEYEALRNDVAENGVLVPVEIDENGDILDGHHRIKAWQELTSEGATLPDYPRIIRAGMTEEQKRNHARKLNVLRRHMGKEEREQMMVDMRKDGMSYRQIAQAAGVSKNTAQRTIESSGVPNGTPGNITGKDGKQYPAKQERKPEPPQHRMDIDYDDQAESLLEDDDAYNWTDEEPEPAQDRRPMPTMILATSEKQQGSILKTLQKAKDTDSAVYQMAASGALSEDDTKKLLNLDQSKRDRVVSNLDASKPDAVRDAISDVNRQDRVEKVNNIAQNNAPLDLGLNTAFPVIYADPPWQYEHSETDSRKIENQYPTMTIEQICDLPVDRIASPDSVLILWTTSPKFAEALLVLEAWGFTYRTCMVWDKEIIGMGYYARQQHELLLFAARGALPVPEAANRPPSVIRIRRDSKHSAKPEEFYTIIERMYPEYEKLEMFARNKREGWHSWGNQA